MANGTNPKVHDSGSLLPNGLTQIQEYRRQIILAGSDTNQDGILDSVAIVLGISSSDPDPDGDGLVNSAERLRGTNPYRADTDGDSVNDYADLFPLDASRSTLAPTSGDVLAPLIEIYSPAGATLN